MTLTCGHGQMKTPRKLENHPLVSTIGLLWWIFLYGVPQGREVDCG